MKKLTFCCIITLSFIGCFLFNVKTVSAESSYMRVITDDTPFYAHYTDDTPLFYLPYTYYVKVIGYENGFSHVECYGTNSIKIDGYVPTDLLYDDDLSVTDPYVDVKIYTLTPSIMYLDSTLSTPMQYVFPSRELDYYGILPLENEILYYIGYNGKLGYVKESEIQPFTLENHPNELTFIQTGVEVPPLEESNNPQEEVNSDNYTTLKIVIIITLSIAGIIGLFVATKKRSENAYIDNTSYYDENEYE